MNMMDRIEMFAGVGVPVPVPVAREVLRALELVEIVTATGERGTFRLTFRLDRGSTLTEQFLLDSGELVRVVLATTADGNRSVVMDGVMVAHTVSRHGHDGRLVIDGEDLTQLMDLNATVARKFPAMPVEARVQLILAGYAVFGMIPIVIPPLLPDVPLPDVPFPQQGTDYSYVRELAERVGYVFTLTPGPQPGSSVAYWGPPTGVGPLPPRVIDFTRDDHVESLRLRFDALHRVAPEASIIEPISKAVIPIPAPDIATLGPPLGAIVPPAQRRVRLDAAARLTPSQAAAALLAEAARSAQAVTGVGRLSIGRHDRRVRAGEIVEVRGMAKPFDGLFAVSRTHDSIAPDDHTQEFHLVRAGLGAAP
jgi:hypothetical protein